VFLAEKRITGIEINVTDEARLLVGFSAVALSVGWPGYSWDQVSEVLLYPDSFDRDYRLGVRDYSGQAHPWGIVILSVPALFRSFQISDSGYHVGFHEFAHLLDLSNSRFDGIPPYLPDDDVRRWEKLMESEEERLRRRDSLLDSYALTGPEEFFAVAVEAFLQIPVRFRAEHPGLYAFLATYFRQDPAVWTAASATGAQ
jgi:Mlc titration factor MtfA (ptsG expression regulator)